VARRRLRRLEVFLDVVYALLFAMMLQYLPQAEDMAWAEHRLGLLQLLVDHRVELLRIFIGLGLTPIYWNLHVNLLAPLAGTDGRHTSLVLLQMAAVCLFVYFAISDPMLAGGPSSPALRCTMLVIAGVFGRLGWSHASRHGLLEADFPRSDAKRVARENLVAPLTALFNLPLSWVGPGYWTVGWLVLPWLVSRGLERIPARGTKDPAS